MTKYKSAVGFPFQTPFLAAEIMPGVVYDLPDTQPNGEPIVWPDEFWTLVDKPTPPAPPAPVVPTPVSESE